MLLRGFRSTSAASGGGGVLHLVFGLLKAEEGVPQDHKVVGRGELQSLRAFAKRPEGREAGSLSTALNDAVRGVARCG